MALYIVATPIGNLKDITLRALETLKEAPVVIVEKWSDSVKLLKVYDIKPEQIISYDENNHHRALPKILEALDKGDAAYITSAGMPGVSDPGARLVTAVREKGVAIFPIPGASALPTAIAMSGFNGGFYFAGFLPKKSGPVVKLLDAAHEGEYNLVFYESPYRIEKIIELIATKYPEAIVFIGREMTKKFEEYFTKTAKELLEMISDKKFVSKGEFVVIVKP